ncbi:MAG: monovalent cation/H(+) antiporter subunit G [Opitutales bacterium]
MSIVVGILVLLGAFFALVAAIGLLRLPDFFCRMHAAAKAGAFGGALLALASALHFLDVRAFLDAALIITFFYLTTPVASHLLGRAAFLRGVSVWEPTQRVELPDYSKTAETASGLQPDSDRAGATRLLSESES